MIIRGLDMNGDWEMGKGFSSYSINSQAIQLNILTKLREWKRDCFAGMNNGIDWENRIGNLATLANQTLLKADIQSLVQSLYGVTSTFNYVVNFNPTTRALSISFFYTDIFQNSININFDPLV